MKKSPFVQFPIHCADAYFLHQALSPQSFSPTDWKTLGHFQRTYRWKVNLASVLEKPHEALVLTDSYQVIRWVNDGFTSMTGYPASAAIHQKPAMLQGEATSSDTRARIRAKLKAEEPFQEVIVNYRRNGESYLCQLNVFPMKDSSGTLQHYLALEKEVA
ncbi:MAG: PAS domain-containing protein [Bacteroidota bacterium]